MTPSEILKTYGVQPNRRRGQNFLIDQNVLKKITSAGGVTSKDTVIEVGAGAGFLTRQLAQHAKRVIAVEIDKKLVEILHAELGDMPNVEIVANDIFAVDIGDILGFTRGTRRSASYSVVANIPYNITSHFFRFFLERDERPSKMTVLIQREVAERVCATSPDSSLLALSVQYFAQPKILFTVSRSCFFPKPKVESAVLELNVKSKKELASQGDAKTFFKLIKAGFSSPRKYCISNLSKGLGVEKEALKTLFRGVGIQEKARAESITLSQWLALVARNTETRNS